MKVDSKVRQEKDLDTLRALNRFVNLKFILAELIMSLKLAELIKGVRECKTQQEERALVNKEKANIRQSFTVIWLD